ncbi:MAG: ribonuclease HII [Verrucomicrobiota bacterium]
MPARKNEKSIRNGANRFVPDDGFERSCREKGYRSVAGVDEVGRGPLAGPVVAAAVILPTGYAHKWLRDSKTLSEAQREDVDGHLRAHPGVCWALGECTPGEIDRHNILRASLLAMSRAVEALATRPDFLLIDGNRGLGGPRPELPLVKGDARCLSIAAASVIAKVHRDAYMVRLAEEFPAYGFERHKGYPTPEHRAALATHGPSPHHRKSFCSPPPVPEEPSR